MYFRHLMMDLSFLGIQALYNSSKIESEDHRLDGTSGDCPVQPPAQTRETQSRLFRTQSSWVLSMSPRVDTAQPFCTTCASAQSPSQVFWFGF